MEPLDPSDLRYHSGIETLKGKSSDPVQDSCDMPSDLVARLERKAAYMARELRTLKGYVRNIRAILGLPAYNSSEEIALSTALQEIQLEIDKRTDIFGNISREIPEDIRV